MNSTTSTTATPSRDGYVSNIKKIHIPAKASRIPDLDVLEVTVIVDSIVVIAGIFARQFLFWIINKMRTALFFYKKENTI